MLRHSKAEKPWAVLKVSRLRYKTAKLWKRTELSRQTFDELIASLPPELFEQLMLEADAEALVATLFNLDGSTDDPGEET